jgi:adenine C2-methylase RlmN of 23S rRNA A2503 and tRNA A37
VLLLLPSTTAAAAAAAGVVGTKQGMGEPLSNYEAVRSAVSMMTDPRYFALGRRHVTVSTVGVVPRILQMAADMPVSD